MAEYCLVSGMLSFCEFPERPNNSLNLTPILYTSLFNTELLMMSSHCYDNQEFLLSVLQGLSLVQVYQKMERRLVTRNKAFHYYILTIIILCLSEKLQSTGNLALVPIGKLQHYLSQCIKA